MDNIFQDHDLKYTRPGPIEANWNSFLLPTYTEARRYVFKVKWMIIWSQ